MHNDQSLHAHNGNHAESLDGMHDAVLPEPEGNLPNGAPSTDIWQNVGDEAVRETVTHAQQLLSNLQAIGVGNLTGELRHAHCQQQL